MNKKVKHGTLLTIIFAVLSLLYHTGIYQLL